MSCFVPFDRSPSTAEKLSTKDIKNGIVFDQWSDAKLHRYTQSLVGMFEDRTERPTHA